MTKLTRRKLLAAGGALPLAGLAAGPARADAPMLGPSYSSHRRFKTGAFEVTTILAETFPREDPQNIFGLNVTEGEFAQVSAQHFLSTASQQFFFTPTLVNTGSELVLFDTGLTGPGTLAAMQDAGFNENDVDIVVLTHMHSDHIGGLFLDDGPTFLNARYIVGRTEWDYWVGQNNPRFEKNVRPLFESITFVGDGDDVVTGITGLAAFGHTPGHMVYRLESEGQGLMIFADLANHPVWSLARPDWEVSFDIDKEAAAASRRNILGMIAADRIPAIGYHMPFPGVGFVDIGAGDAEFQWVPESGQLIG